MKHFIFAALMALCGIANAQVAQPTNGNFTCEITGAPAGANPSACETQNVVNLILNNDLGCQQATESDRYWIPNPVHGSTAKDLDIVWSISVPSGVTCPPPLSGVSTLGYTTDTLTCPPTSSELDDPYDGSVRCYCPYQNVSGYGNVPGVWEGYPTPSCMPDTVYINPFYQPNAPQ